MNNCCQFDDVTAIIVSLKWQAILEAFSAKRSLNIQQAVRILFVRRQHFTEAINEKNTFMSCLF